MVTFAVIFSDPEATFHGHYISERIRLENVLRRTTAD